MVLFQNMLIYKIQWLFHGFLNSMMAVNPVNLTTGLDNVSLLYENTNVLIDILSDP